MKSIRQMIEELEETTRMSNKLDGNDWAMNFVADMYSKYIDAGKDTTSFTEKQVEKILQLYHRYVTSVHKKEKLILHNPGTGDK